MISKRWVVCMLVLACCLISGVVNAQIPKDTLVIGVNTENFITHDPAVCFEVPASLLVKNLYAPLVDVYMDNGNFAVRPELAEKWEVAADGKTWTFHLREGIVFADGTPITADAVVYSYKRAIKLQKSPSFLFTQIIGLTEDGITAPDQRTVQIVTNGASANIVLTNIGGGLGGIVNPAVVQANEKDGDMGAGWLTDHSAGAGPYVLQEWTRKTQIVLTANPKYWRGEPRIKTIILQDIPEETNQFLLVQKGDIDIAWNLTAEQGNQLKNAGGDVRLVTTPSQANEYLGINAGFEPFKNPKVRQAVKYAIDYDSIIKNARGGFAMNNQQFLPVGYFGYTENNPFTKDVEKAKALMKEAGYENGFEVELVASTREFRKAEATIIQENLAQIGIKASINIMPNAQLLEKFRAQGLNLVIAGWGVDYPDADALATPFANHRVNQLCWRLGWLDDKAADLVLAAGKELDEKKRFQMYQDLTNYWQENGPFAMLYQEIMYWGVRNSVKGMEKAMEGYSVRADFTEFYKE